MIEMYERSLARTGTVVAGVDRERFSDPTPCDDWDVEKLLDHIIGGCLTFAGGGSGGPVDAMQERGFAAKDHVTAYQEAAASALETFRAPGALEGTLSFRGETPLERRLSVWRLPTRRYTGGTSRLQPIRTPRSTRTSPRPSTR